MSQGRDAGVTRVRGQALPLARATSLESWLDLSGAPYQRAGFFARKSHARAVVIGRGISTMNTAVMLGAACMQTLSGIIIGAFEPLASGARTEEAYRALFGTLIVAVAIYSRSQDVRPSDEMRAVRQ